MVITTEKLRKLNQLTRDVQKLHDQHVETLMKLIVHPDSTDEQILEGVHSMKASWAQMRESNKKLYEVEKQVGRLPSWYASRITMHSKW